MNVIYTQESIKADPRLLSADFDFYSQIDNMHERKPTYSAKTVKEMLDFQLQVTKGK